MDLPNIANNLKTYKKGKVTVRFRVTPIEKKQIMEKASKNGYKNTSDFVRQCVLN